MPNSRFLSKIADEKLYVLLLVERTSKTQTKDALIVFLRPNVG